MERVVYTGGTFDLLHAGHINLLRECKKLGKVVVALNTDTFVETYKRKPIMSYEERREALLACKYVDVVVKNAGGADSKLALDVVDPDIFVHGDDWTGKSLMKQLGVDKKYFKKIKVIYLPYTKGVSTTEILTRI
jgi:glycerol-3-phosphate cytidylyltransferase